jgi:hypothetical protein
LKALQTTGIVTSAHQLVVDVPADVPSGPHRVVVVLDEDEAVTPEPLALSWGNLALPGAQWPAGGVSLRREDLYADTDR